MVAAEMRPKVVGGRVSVHKLVEAWLDIKKK